MAVLPGAVGALLFGAAAVWLLRGPTQVSATHVVLASVVALVAIALVPWQLLDAAGRRYTLTKVSLIHRQGVLGCVETEIPFGSIRAVSVRQNLVQRWFGCGDVVVFATGIGGGAIVTSSAGAHSITLRSIPDFRAVGDLLRARMHAARDR